MMDGFGQPPQNQYQPPQQQPPYVGGPSPMPGTKPKGAGCGLTGCLVGCLVVFVLFVGVVGGAGYYVYHVAMTYVFQDSNLEIDPISLDDEEKAALAQKYMPVVEAFQKDTGETMDLSLTGDEVSYLLLHGSEMNSNVHGGEGIFNVSFPDANQVLFKASVPATMERDSVKYVNFQGAGEISITDGKVTIKLSKLAFGVSPDVYEVPGAFLEAMNQSFSQQMQNEPQLQNVWERVRDLKIEKGVVHMKLRALKWPEHATNHKSGGSTDDETEEENQ